MSEHIEIHFSPILRAASLPDSAAVSASQRVTVEQRYIMLGAVKVREIFAGRPDGARINEIYEGIMRLLPDETGWTDGDFVLRGRKYSGVRFRQLVNDLVARGLLLKVAAAWYDRGGAVRSPRPHYSVTESGAAAIGANVHRALRDLLAIRPEWRDYGGEEEYVRRRRAGAVGAALASPASPDTAVLDRYARRLEVKREQTRLRQIARLTAGLAPDAAERVRAELMAAAPRAAMARRGKKKHGRGELLGIMAVSLASGGKESPAHSRAILEQYTRLDKRIGMHYLMIILRTLGDDGMVESVWQHWRDDHNKMRAKRWHWWLTEKGEQFLAWTKKELERRNGGVFKIAPLKRWDDPGEEGARDVR